MIALYLPVLRPAALDRARALLAALGPAAVVVSPHPAPPVAPARWVRLDDDRPATWKAWVRAHAPRVVIVDGSGAHARAVTGSGALVGVVAQADGVVDPDLGAAYSEVDVILAPWSADGADESWPARWQERTVHVGAIGWQAASSVRRLPPRSPGTDGRWHCVVLSGTGSGPGPRDRRAMMTAVPGWQWSYVPEHAALADGPVWDALWRSSVVVCAPTPANLAAVAAVRKPAVLVVGGRSHAQAFLAARARGSAPVVVRDGWPGPEEWRWLLDDARRLDSGSWHAWSPEQGLARLSAIAEDASDTGARARTGRRRGFRSSVSAQA